MRYKLQYTLYYKLYKKNKVGQYREAKKYQYCQYCQSNLVIRSSRMAWSVFELRIF